MHPLTEMLADPINWSAYLHQYIDVEFVILIHSNERIMYGILLNTFSVKQRCDQGWPNLLKTLTCNAFWDRFTVTNSTSGYNL